MRLPASASQQDVLAAIEALAVRANIHGILLQLPLPEGLDENAAIAAIPVSKDVDSFREGSPVASPLILAILALVRASGRDPSGRTAAVFAHNDIFKKRLLERLAGLGFSETDGSPDLAVVALGQAASFGRDRVKENGVVIDVGTNRVEGKVVGDADTVSLDGYLSARSPVPGGIGPLTIAYLLKNIVELCKRSSGTP
jgi:methylenetetrahydrofolate dehydrogenase (NADP+)/methenyltetrahydrofolate cyclohydrolase